MSQRDLTPRDARDRLIVALDVPRVADAEALVDRLGDAVTFYKIGMQLAFAGGLPLVESLVASGRRVFLDMKLLDIDNTVEMGVRSIVGLGATLTTIHAYPQAMEAAVRGRGDSALGLLGVSVLTSMDDDDLKQAGYAGSAEDIVAARAAAAAAVGMDGVVCSAREAARVRDIVGRDMIVVTPGIRPSGSDSGDQKRIVTPADAIGAGADYLVVGRPVSQAADPAAAADAIVGEIAGAL
ncbi:MAG TPA: orotidine-5'-phosphate decarboxylase [Afifellaceae bacterium]|nr:orotidine-5'-phosphate decarboxylase [Afifellaceae bacterium]